MNQIDCFDFYLWSIGELCLRHEPQDEFLFFKED